MTQDEIIRLAEEAGVHEGGKENWVAGNRWEDFAKLVAAKEREACANICQDLINRIKPIYCVSTENAMKLIRARGQHD
jgi:hypothetical protein